MATPCYYNAALRTEDLLMKSYDMNEAVKKKSGEVLWRNTTTVKSGFSISWNKSQIIDLFLLLLNEGSQFYYFGMTTVAPQSTSLTATDAPIKIFLYRRANSLKIKYGVGLVTFLIGRYFLCLFVPFW